MVEDIEDGRCKVLFMTNRQAELVSKDNDCIEKLLDALDVPKPGLVIDLLHSWGFYDSTTLQERTLIRTLTLTPSLTPNPNPTLTLTPLCNPNLNLNSTTLQEKMYMENENSAWCAGVKHKTAPFANLADERDIEQRLELFMSEVLIPLAEQARRPCDTRQALLTSHAAHVSPFPSPGTDQGTGFVQCRPQ